MTIAPEQFNRRSFVYPRLVEAGAEFEQRGDCAVATHVPGGDTAPLRLVDLSPLMRTGIKGPKAREYLQAQGWPVPEANNTTRVTDDGDLVLRLGDNELLLLSNPAAEEAAMVAALEADAPGAGAWPVPRRDSHCWFVLQGAAVVECLAKLCGVDLRAEHFPAGQVAQTSVARLNAIVVRDPGGDGDRFHLLADSASANWFWDVLLDAMNEFDGAAAGLRDLG